MIEPRRLKNVVIFVQTLEISYCYIYTLVEQCLILAIAFSSF